VPIYGQISAGLGEADENASVGMLSVDASTAGLDNDARVFALKVCGDSMIGAQISEGDLVIMEMREPQNEDIVAAIIDGETTLKRYIVDEEGPFLRAENPDFRIWCQPMNWSSRA
jgi:repressor LexA